MLHTKCGPDNKRSPHINVGTWNTMWTMPTHVHTVLIQCWRIWFSFSVKTKGVSKQWLQLFIVCSKNTTPHCVLALHAKCGHKNRRGPHSEGTWSTMWTHVYTKLLTVLESMISVRCYTEQRHVKIVTATATQSCMLIKCQSSLTINSNSIHFCSSILPLLNWMPISKMNALIRIQSLKLACLKVNLNGQYHDVMKVK